MQLSRAAAGIKPSATLALNARARELAARGKDVINFTIGEPDFDTPKNIVVIPYISMHGSTERMVQYLVASLAERGVKVHEFDLAVTDIGKLAITLVDAATIVIGTPTVQVGPHPNVAYAAQLANVLRPKARYASVIASYGWGSKAIEQIAGMIPNLKVEIIDPVLVKGYPKEDDFEALDKLADTIARKHNENGFA